MWKDRQIILLVTMVIMIAKARKIAAKIILCLIIDNTDIAEIKDSDTNPVKMHIISMICKSFFHSEIKRKFWVSINILNELWLDIYIFINNPVKMHIISIICKSFFHSKIICFYYNIFINAIVFNIVFFYSKLYNWEIMLHSVLVLYADFIIIKWCTWNK